METGGVAGDDCVVAVVTSTPLGVIRGVRAVEADFTLNGFRLGVVIFIFSGGGGISG